MAKNQQPRTSNTDGLILSSFNILQDKAVDENGGQQLKLSGPFLNEAVAGCTGQDVDNGHIRNDGLSTPVCGEDAAEGDEMFDVTDNTPFRGDEVGDALDNDTNNNSLDREDEEEEEEEEEEDEEEDDDDSGGSSDFRRAGIQVIQPSNQVGPTDGTPAERSCAQPLPDLGGYHHAQEGFVDLVPTLEPRAFLDSSRDWHADPNTANGGARYPGDWCLPLSSVGSAASRDMCGEGVLSGSSSPEEGRNGTGEDQHWKFLHGRDLPAADQHHWGGPKHGASKVVVGSANPSWVAPPKEGVVEEHPHHDLQALHHHGNMEASAHWGQHVRPEGIMTPDASMPSMRNLFNIPPGPAGMNASNVNNSFVDMACPSTGTWNLGGHLPATPTLGPIPRPIKHHDLSCRRAAGPPGFYHQTPPQSYPGFQGPGADGWLPSGMSPGPSDLPPDNSSDHYKVANLQPGLVCKSAMLNKRGKGRNARGGLGVLSADKPTPTKSRSALDQLRQQSHPYQMKEHKKVVRDVYPVTSTNVHTLKASHIVSWYIDYLIHENEHLTQISRAFSLPVNLFHSDDFYFMESLKKKVHFPSLKFLTWMQQNLPSINVNAIDFHEGRPPVATTWNQDWFWQNKSRRDIIHDVFFYFQHRRVTCEN